MNIPHTLAGLMLAATASVSMAGEIKPYTAQTFDQLSRAGKSVVVEVSANLATHSRERQAEEAPSRGDVGHGSAEGGGQGKALSPQAKREAVVAIRQKVNISERRACRLVGLSRSVLRYEAQRDSSNEGLKARLVELAHERRRFGYRRLHLPLEREGLHANHKRVHRLYQRGWFGCAASAATPRRDGRA